MKIVVTELEANLRRELECHDINVSFILSRPVKIIIDCPGCWSERICKERMTKCGFLEAKDKMTDTVDKKELILKIIPLKKNIEECAEEVDGPHWRAYKSSYYKGYLDAVSDIVNKINE